MRIGVDFDNTIVCYDDLFHTVALERGLIPPDLPRSKSAVRDYLRGIDNEDAWTEMQGYVYGKRMIEDATPYPGVLEFFQHCPAPLCIISHKTRSPYLGEPYDLHAAARAWLAGHGFTALVGENNLYFELTKADKLRRITQVGCTHFIDDLPEFLLEPDFPPIVRRFLFDPNDLYPVDSHLQKVASWHLLLQWAAEGRL